MKQACSVWSVQSIQPSLVGIFVIYLKVSILLSIVLYCIVYTFIVYTYVNEVFKENPNGNFELVSSWRFEANGCNFDINLNNFSKEWAIKTNFMGFCMWLFMEY